MCYEHGTSLWWSSVGHKPVHAKVREELANEQEGDGEFVVKRV